jgi:hypothetical protein
VNPLGAVKAPPDSEVRHITIKSVAKVPVGTVTAVPADPTAVAELKATYEIAGVAVAAARPINII